MVKKEIYIKLYLPTTMQIIMLWLSELTEKIRERVTGKKTNLLIIQRRLKLLKRLLRKQERSWGQIGFLFGTIDGFQPIYQNNNWLEGSF